MKRQSKPEKIKKEKSTAPGEWLYFAPVNVTVRSIYEVLTDDYEVGYESMNEIAGKLKNSWYQMESHETEIQVVYKKDLFSEDIERFLYSYE